MGRFGGQIRNPHKKLHNPGQKSSKPEHSEPISCPFSARVNYVTSPTFGRNKKRSATELAGQFHLLASNWLAYAHVPQRATGSRPLSWISVMIQERVEPTRARGGPESQATCTAAAGPTRPVEAPKAWPATLAALAARTIDRGETAAAAAGCDPLAAPAAAAGLHGEVAASA